ncbi:TMEM175 family protein [Streptococcus suis]|uniref:TMEM175 family protein n=1 Tax=Streptococcus suis TaxID=1307 RepID=UPI002AAC4D3A|nr:TMEM175 family protein [Streptococcus suis]
MNKERISAFVDAVLAIIMTILVLELKRPESLTVEGFWALRNNFFSYTISFF